MDSQDVNSAVDEAVRVLDAHATKDWCVNAGSLEWSCWTTAAHIAHDLLAYAGQVAARPREGYLPFDLKIQGQATPRELLEVIKATGYLLSSAVATTEPRARAWHFGLSDAGGFAAMGIGEVLLHTYDIAQGLDIRWDPPERLCAGILSRLMPDSPKGDPVRVLLWSTGRGDLAGFPPVSSWVWKAAVT